MNPLLSFIALAPEWCQGLVQIGASVLLQSTLLLLIGWGIGAALRRRGPALQNRVYGLSFVGVVVCGLATCVLAGRGRPALPLSLPLAHRMPAATPVGPAAQSAAPSPNLPGASVQGMESQTVPKAKAEDRPPVSVRFLPPAPTGFDAPPVEGPLPRYEGYLPPEEAFPIGLMGWFYVILVGFWLGGAFGLLGWLMLCYMGVRGIRRRSIRVEGGEALALLEDLCSARRVRAPLLLASREVHSLYLIGLFRPAILLPADDLGGFDLLTLRAVLAHEVEHLARRDGLWTLALRVLRAVFWFQPLLWLLIQRWEQSCEERCDLGVIQQDIPPRAYADCLLRLAERFLITPTERAVGTGILSFGSSLGRRIQRLMAASSLRSPLQLAPGAGFALALGMFAVALPAVLWIRVVALSEKNVWGNDFRLDRRVAITAEGVPVGDLLTLLSEKSGVELQADASVADEKVIVFSPARPLRETLTDLAALYNDLWTPGRGRGGRASYRLLRSPRAQKYEEDLSAALRRRMLAQMDAQIIALNEPPEELARRPAEDPIRDALTDPDSRLATDIFAWLPPAEREELMDRWATGLSISTLPPDLKARLKNAFAAGDRARELKSSGWTWEKLENSDLSFFIYGAQEETLEIKMTCASGSYFFLTSFNRRTWYLLPPHGNPYTGKAVAANAALPAPHNIMKAEAAWPDRLRALAERTGQPVMSDYYRSKAMLSGADSSGAAPDGTQAGALDAFARPEGYLWWAQNRTLLFRKRDWYHQRRYEFPDRWALALVQKLKRQNGLPTYADMLRLRELTPEQMVGLNSSMGMRSYASTLAHLQWILEAADAALVAQQRSRNEPLLVGEVSKERRTGEERVKPSWRDLRQSRPDGALRFNTSLVGGMVRQDGSVSEPAIDSYRDDPMQNKQPVAFLFFEAFRTPISANTILSGREALVPLGELKPGAPFVNHVSIAFLYGDYAYFMNELFSLPLVLPDDRRDKTQIEVTP